MVKNNILNIIGIKEKTEGTWGVEIEAEGHNLPGRIQEYWRVDADPSLKAGLEAFEYVLHEPLSLEETKKALDYLRKLYKELKTEVIETDTSGVHVHLNVQEYTPKQLFTLIVAYLTLEEVILKYCGEQREGNHFCLRAKDAEGLVYALSQSAINRNFKLLNTDKLRYGSLNVYSLFKYGSIEFRAMRGTGNLNAIYGWVEILNNIREEALNYKTPLDVILSLSHDGEEVFLRRFLKDKAEEFIKVDGFEEMLRNGVRRVQSIAFLPDWATWKDERKNPFPVERARERN